MTSIVISILGNASNFIGATNQAGSAMDKWAAKAGKAGALVAGAVGAAALSAVKSAADQSSAVSAWTQVTGKQMDAQQKTIARGLNLSQYEYAKSFTTLSSLYQSNGLSQKKANEMAAKGLKLAADQAAFGNTTVGEAVEAQAGLLKGSGELLEKYAISITAADVAARMKKDGLDKLEGSELKAATAATKMKLVQEQSAKFTGQAARESGSLESRQQKLTATIEDFKAKLGTQLLPIVEQFIGKLQSAAEWVAANETKTKIIVGVLAGFAGVLLAVAGAIKVVRAVQAAWNGIMIATNVIMFANPVVLVIAAIVALGVALVVAYKKCETFRNIVNAAWGMIRSATEKVFGAVKVFIGAAIDVIVGYFNAWKKAITTAIGVIKSVPDKVKAAFDGARTWLKNAGMEIVNGLTDGIKSVAMAPVNAVKGIAGKIAGFLPGSPVKEGPLRVLNNGYAGRTIVKMIADGIKSGDTAAQDALAATLNKMRDRVTAARDIAKQIRASFAIAFEPQQISADTGRGEGKTLAESLREQVANAEKFAARIAQLRKAGLREQAIKQLVDAGPQQSVGAANEIFASGASGIKEVNSLIGRMNAAGSGLAARETLQRSGIDVRKEQPVKVTFDVTGADSELKQLIRKMVRVEGGGNVQVAFGRGR